MRIFHTITEGGQIWTHRFRMLRQVLKMAIIASFIINVIVFAVLMSQVDFKIYEGTWHYLKGNVINQLSPPKQDINKLFLHNVDRHYSDSLPTPQEQITASPHVNQLLKIAIENLQWTGSISFISFIAIIAFFLLKGSLSKQRKHISGRRMVSSRYLALKLYLTGKASNIQIGKLPLLKGTETQHIMVTGGTGSGKTNCFHHILPKIRKNGQRAIVVDTTGAFMERYYRPGKDILLNPFDPRSACWHPWAECSSKFDIADIAECFIPSSHSEQENYWRIAARTLFCALLQKGEMSCKTSDLTRWILFEPLVNLCNYVKGTKGAAHMDMNSEKTAASIRSVTSSFLSCLELFDDTDTPFSIREWMRRDADDDSWLFLSCTPAQRASLRPIISCWFSIATRNLIQLTPDFQRRVWFIVDELPSLNKLKDLEIFLAESRKYGGCALLALQSMAQLESIYGREVTKTIIGNCATKIAFSEQDPEIGMQISKAFGEREIKEYNEGISYGAHETRDAVNLSLQTKSIPLVSVSEIQSLKRNQAFVKLPENYPITKIKLSISASTA